MKWLLVPLVALFLAFVPAQAFADDGKDDGNALIRINADVLIPAGETIDTLVVIHGNATIEGAVTGSVFVIDGNAIVSGSVANELSVISGNIDLRSGASVKNVSSIRGDIIRADGVTVAGNIKEQDSLGFLQAAGVVFSFLFWVSLTVALVAAGLVFAAIGGRQLTNAARAMTGDAVNTVIGMVAVWVAVPVIAVVAMITLIGLPLGIGTLLFFLPAIGFLGYIVAGARLGGAVTGLLGHETAAHPYLATTIGIIALQIIALVPVVGAFVAFIAAVWGAGALAYIAYRAAGGRGFGPTSIATPGSTAPSGTQALASS